MTNYAKSVNFAVKDTLTSGDPNKIVSGAEIDTEFNNVASSSTTKIDKVPAATAGNLASFTATGSVQDSGENQTTIVQIAAPAGVVMAFGGNTAPTGWLECDGSAVSRTTYSDLFNNIGTNFGAGDGTNTFNLPDVRGEFIRGWDNGRDVDSGRVIGSTQGESIQSHSHDYTLWQGDQFERGGGRTGAAIPGVTRRDNNRVDQFSDPNYDFPTSSEGGTETRPRNVAMMYIIKT